MTGQPEHVLVIGAGLGGVRTAEQLRAAGFQGRISLVGAEPHVPYDRPPLSKQILTGEWEPGPGRPARHSTSSRSSACAPTSGWPRSRCSPGEVELSDGSTLHGDAVVIATGLVARTLPGQPAHVHTLRTLEDALALRATLDRIGSLLVVGRRVHRGRGGERGPRPRHRGDRAGGAAVPAARALGPDGRARWPAGCSTEGGVDLRPGCS